MDRVLTEEQAAEALKKAVDCFDADLDSDARKTLLKSFMSGRLVFNEQDESFTVYLVKPLELENGEKINQLKITEPTFEQLRSAMKSSNQIEQAIIIISNMAGISSGIIQRLKTRDITVCGAVMSFFA